MNNYQMGIIAVMNTINNNQQAIDAYEFSLVEIREDYKSTIEARTEAGVPIQPYEEWLESELARSRNLVKYYQSQIIKGNTEVQQQQAAAGLTNVFGEVRTTLMAVLENETGGGDSCRYCGVEEIGLDKDGHEINRADEEASEKIYEFHINHEQWCPSYIIDKLFSGRLAAYEASAGKENNHV